ncbi:glycosyltransferase family 39 protein [Flavobacterium tegetincola]|uniref:glycosyltransferase family 39 protein n=1 Tax=Flavobacterium tegetincola TaxID=150172 RepID=UPI0004291229|nr:glycosyltransferase family 39 protein [Flavobacterium tegetincola]
MKLLIWIKNNYSMTIIIIVAIVLRFFNLDYQSLWVDEIYTMIESNQNFTLSELYNSIVTSDPHPPLYFLLAYIFFNIFGYTALVLKVLSALLSVAGVYAIYLLGKELCSKKTGIYAAILLTINFFSIYYAQEGRMYSLLFLTTTLSFYYLIKFIKLPNIKTAILFCIFSTLMIYSHLFALFTLISQYLILLYFIIISVKESRKKFFIYTLIIGIVSIVMYIPVIGIILNNLGRESIWIKMPTLDVYTQFFKDFFGESELVLFLIVMLIIAYFINLFSVKETIGFKTNPKVDKLTFSFIIISLWILVTLLLPLIRTYTSLPILINRYFINILPAILILIAIGLKSIKSNIVKTSFLSFIIIFSLTDILIVKKFYFTPYKSQFREVSNFIIENKSSDEPVATSLAPYFNFYLNNDKFKTIIIDKPLQLFVDEMMVDSTKKASFWYADAHSKPFVLSSEATQYLEKYFTIENSIDYYDAWTKHYVIGENKLKEINVSNFDRLIKKSKSKIKYWIENFEIVGDSINLSGWAYIERQNSIKLRTKVLLVSKDERCLGIQAQSVYRPDVSKANKGNFNFDNSGFQTILKTERIPVGEYTVAIMIINTETKEEELVMTDKTFQKK